MYSGTTAGVAVLLTVTVLLCHCPASCRSAKLPKSFVRCSGKQPELDKCFASAVLTALKAMKDGIPSLHVLPIDPLLVSSTSLELGRDQSVNFKLDMTNASLTGLTDNDMEYASVDMQNHSFRVQSHVPKVQLKGDYEIKGRFLLLPLNGKGKFQMALESTDVAMFVMYDEKNVNGDVYWDMKPFDIKLENSTKFSVNFENLFNGDTLLGESTNRALNDNWEVLWKELRPSFEETFGQIFATVANVIYSRVPIKDQFTE